ncbi:hypothetical protein BOX37_12270 [Nocardia mangyaensis]|uniref:WXG100 family type VII secretion target n=1 Tax=Nocardia mangyaensis TaxID=2213200 RepID=A0A1J0VRE8_9NOCA|nr:hypothetical protein [Nocardia mangyaensis]APE34605.1 hypothetical protein BOX37_12270 [Nocardia mangyaensis]
MSESFSVDLDDLDEVTARIRGYQDYLTDALAELQQRIGELNSSWRAWQQRHSPKRTATGVPLCQISAPP